MFKQILIEMIEEFKMAARTKIFIFCIVFLVLWIMAIIAVNFFSSDKKANCPLEKIQEDSPSIPLNNLPEPNSNFSFSLHPYSDERETRIEGKVSYNF